MSRGVNKVFLLGHLGNDPEVKYTQSGMAITTISLATSSKWKDRDGNEQERTEWHRVKFFGKLAEIAGEYLTKGKQVFVEGSIRYDKFESEGETKYFTDIIADQMQMLGGGGGERQDRDEPRRESRRGSTRNEPPARGGYGGGQRSQAPAPRNDEPFPDDDLPF